MTTILFYAKEIISLIVLLLGGLAIITLIVDRLLHIWLHHKGTFGYILDYLENRSAYKAYKEKEASNERIKTMPVLQRNKDKRNRPK